MGKMFHNSSEPDPLVAKPDFQIPLGLDPTRLNPTHTEKDSQMFLLSSFPKLPLRNKATLVLRCLPFPPKPSLDRTKFLYLLQLSNTDSSFLQRKTFKRYINIFQMLQIWLKTVWFFFFFLGRHFPAYIDFLISSLSHDMQFWYLGFLFLRLIFFCFSFSYANRYSDT